MAEIEAERAAAAAEAAALAAAAGPMGGADGWKIRRSVSLFKTLPKLLEPLLDYKDPN
jgi:hypothetical protein